MMCNGCSSQVHELWTGVCLYAPSPMDFNFAGRNARWSMKPFDDAQIEDYIATNRWVGYSGAYAIEEENDPYLVIEDGSLSNVIGLPMEWFAQAFNWII